LWDKKTVIIKEKTKERVNEFLKRKEKAKLTLKTCPCLYQTILTIKFTG